MQHQHGSGSIAEGSLAFERSGLTIVAAWESPGGESVRVVRWTLVGHERALYRWARGLDLDFGTHRWAAGVALERQDGHGARWQTLARQEIEGAGRALPAERLRGWEAGLVARGVKLAARLGGVRVPDHAATP
jgi:hypothetical protein